MIRAFIIIGKTVEMLRAQLHYKYEILEWGSIQVSHIWARNSSSQVTNTPFHEREDEAHVLKVGQNHLDISS